MTTIKPMKPKRSPKPKWLIRNLPTGPNYEKVRNLLKNSRLNTVCQEAKCPNIFECFSRHTSTFLIMGPNCTRNCKYCSVTPKKVLPLDPDEPKTVAEASKILGLKYVVVTSVTRDDLPDGGAEHFAKTIHELRSAISDVKIEVLIPDFKGDSDALKTVMDAKPDVLNHNIETVPRLFPIVRRGADYQLSLDLLKKAREMDPSIPTKSGIMLGLGETDEEIEGTLSDLLSAGCERVTMGQYLQPGKENIPVDRFITPEAFDAWRVKAEEMGFTHVASGPFVRSSYMADQMYVGEAEEKEKKG